MIEKVNKNKSQTLNGLKQVIIFYTIMFLTSATYAVYIFIYSLGGSLDLGLILFPSLIITLIILLSLLGIYWGIGKIHKGNKDFGTAHEKSTLRAKELITWGIILYFVAGFFIYPFFTEIIIISVLIRTLIFVPFWLALIYSIKEISTSRINNLLWIAIFSRAILYFISNYYSRFYSLNLGENYTEYSILIPLIAIVPSSIFIYCYYSTYKKIKNVEPLAD